MLLRTSLFLSNRSQAVRLPKAVAFGQDVHDVAIMPDGPQRIIVPVHMAWDDFFETGGSEVGFREQPEIQDREEL